MADRVSGRLNPVDFSQRENAGFAPPDPGYSIGTRLGRNRVETHYVG
jgi:hypothetical protein